MQGAGVFFIRNLYKNGKKLLLINHSKNGNLKKAIKIFLEIIINSIIGFLIFIYLLYSKTGQTASLMGHLALLIYFIAVVNTIAFIIIKTNRLITQKNPNIKKTGYRFATSFFANYLIFFALAFAASQIYMIYSSKPYSVLVSENYEAIVRLCILVFYILLLYLTIDFFIYSFRRYSENKIRSINREKNHQNLQLELLKKQLSPHYLFNNLNTISSLVYKDISTTEKYIRKLAKTYQYILNSDKHKLVSVQQELEFVLDYTELLKIRFQHAIELKINLNQNMQTNFIPPMCLQVLVENAVKHNVATPKEKLIINISSKDNNSLLVSNNITKSPQNVTSFNIGLNNLRAQLAFFTNKKIKIDKSNRFCVTIPIQKENRVKHA